MLCSTKIIGDRQFQKALELYETAKVPLNGPVQYIHTFVNMHNVTVLPEFTGLNQRTLNPTIHREEPRKR